ncbi:MAG: hypothetical protein NTX25_12185, partial [Proteobacteria bacterium]|nr:hypothetical protein [Pseudomonadota bacterium]
MANSKIHIKIEYFVSSVILILGLFIVASCQKSKEKDTQVSGGEPTDGVSSAITMSSWHSSNFFDPLAKKATLTQAVLKNGGPAEPILLTHTQANLPVALFQGATKEVSNEAISPVPFLAFKVEDKSRITIRHIKGVNGQNISSQILTPIACPSEFIKHADLSIPSDAGTGAGGGEAEGVTTVMTSYCIPLINAVVPGILLPTDNSGSYIHEFIISIKNGNKSASVLSTKIATRIIIPDSVLSIKASDDLAKLSLSDRLTLATNDLVGSPRRDFKAFEIRGSVAPGVQTAWVLKFSNVKMTIEEEVFFEQPVVIGSNPAIPEVSRGGSFYKRKSVVDSLDHLRLQLLNGASSDDVFPIASGSSSTIEMKIKDGNAPLQIFIMPDFGSPNATKSMNEYVKPFAPTFCPKEQSAFKPEEWRQSRLNPYFVACEAITRSRIVDLSDAVSRGATNPLETFYGAFSYMPRMGQRSLGGTNGVLSLRISISGTLNVAVRNPHDLTTTSSIGTMPLSY